MLRAFQERRRARPPAPRIKVEQRGPNDVGITVGHPDEAIGRVALRAAFGTVDAEFAQSMLANVVNATRTDRSAPVREADVNALLAAVAGIAPADEAEAMLAVQMVATHQAAITHLRRLGTVEMVPQAELAGNLAVKLLRTYAMQMEALKRYRSKSEQRVTVTHQHVNVSAENAIVGVQAPASAGGGGDGRKAEERAHAPTAVTYQPLEPVAPMRCADAERAPVLRPGRGGQDTL